MLPDLLLRLVERHRLPGEISLEFFANEAGLSLRDLYAALEARDLPTSNIGSLNRSNAQETVRAGHG